METEQERRATHSALLSFVLPGLGQLVSGRPAIGVVFAAPAALLALVGVWLITSPSPDLGLLLDPAVLGALLLANVALLAWRAAAVLHAFGMHARWSRRRASSVVVWGLVALVALTQAVPTSYVARMAGTLDRISDQAGNDDDRLLGPATSPSTRSPEQSIVVAAPESASPTTSPTASPVPESPPASATPSSAAAAPSSPTATPSSRASDDDDPVRLEERVTVLLLGTDDLSGRSHRLTDTMLVVSLGAEDRRPMMVSVPRDLYGVPLPDGRVYNARLNSLAGYARARPDEFPDGGAATLRQTIELLLDMEIHYVAAVDMLGLVDIVDALGGVEIEVREEIEDPNYPPATGGSRGFEIEPGLHHMDGETALAYVRSRRGEGGSDFVRAGRQQRLLAAIRHRVSERGLTSTLPTLLDIVDEHVRTDIPRDRLGHFANAVVDARWDAVERLVLNPPEYVRPGTTDAGAYVLHPDIDAIRQAVAEMRD